MFFLIWRGWGILLLPILFVWFMGGAVLGGIFDSSGLSPHVSLRLAYAITTLAAAAGIWFLAKALTGKAARRLVDPNTGQEFVIRKDAGSLFFINMKYWTFIVLALGLVMCIIGDTTPGGALSKLDAASGDAASPAADAASQ